MRIALIGGGTIARLVLEHAHRAELGSFEIVALLGRPGGAARARELAREFSVKYVETWKALAAEKPQAVIEAASHEAVREHLLGLLEAGIGVVVLSAGALIDDALRTAAEAAARRTGALLFVPSGGIGGLDALRTACLAGVDEASIEVAKPPAAWKGIAYFERRGLRVDGPKGPPPPFGRRRARRRAALPAERQHRGNPGAGRNRPGPDAAEGRGRSRADPEHPYDPRVGSFRALQPASRERSCAREPEDFLARLLQRARGAAGAWLSGSVRDIEKQNIGIPPHFLTKRRIIRIISGSAGGVPERLKGADCKSVGLAPTLVRIQPPPPAFRAPGVESRRVKRYAGEVILKDRLEGGGSSMVEQKPSKLMTRVRFPSPAPQNRMTSQHSPM